MNPSTFSPGEFPPRKWESVDSRYGTMSSGHTVATESLHRNCRDGCHGNRRTCSSGSFHDLLPNMHEIHNEAALYGAGVAQRAPVHLTYKYSGPHAEHFCDHDHHQDMSNERFYQGITGSATTISNRAGHQHGVCDRGCCGSVALHREKNSSANRSVEKTRPISRSSLFVDSPEFSRNAVAVGSMPHCPSTPREVERMSSSLSTRSMANSGFPMQTKGANNQVMLYGWFLMNPHRERNSKDPPPRSSVAIGGYRCRNMEETGFFATGAVLERLARWKLRTSDGLEVLLMGMNDIEKSVANGFSPAVVQCFMIGFPAAWMHMLSNLPVCAPKGSSQSMQSLSAGPTNSAGPSGVIRSNIKDCLRTPVTLASEANVVESILQSTLFTGGSDIDVKMADLRRCSTAATTPSQDGVSSDANSMPQSHLGHEQVVDDVPAVGQNMVSTAATTPLNDGVSSNANSTPQSHLGHEQDVADIPIPEVGPNMVSTAATTPLNDGVSSDAKSMPQSHLGHDWSKLCTTNEQDVADIPEVGSDVFPADDPVGTDIPEVGPNIVSADHPAGTVEARDKRKKPRSESRSPARYMRKKLRSESQSPARDEKRKPTRECRSPAAATPEVEQIKVSDAHPVGIITRRDRRKLRSNAPVADVPVVEPMTPVGTVKARDERKKPRSQSQSPAAETPEVKQVQVSDADPAGVVAPRYRRKLRSNAPVADIPVVESIAVSVADPVGTAKTRDRSKRPRSESRSPVPDNPLVEPVTGPANNVRSSDCHVGASSDVTEEKAEAELHEELGEDEIVNNREDLNVEVNQAFKGKSVVKGRVRKKRLKISRNYYQRGKKKSSSKTAQAHEKTPPRSDTFTSTLKIPTEGSKVVQEMKESSKEKVGRSTMPTRRDTSKSSLSLEVPESSVEEGHVTRSGRVKTSIVPPPLPPPRVADKSKVTEAFGLKRSKYGRLLVPPLASWRSQSIRYDTDGSIIGISDGFEGSEEENCTGYFNFKPPEDKDARTIQRRLCKAAVKGSRKR